MLFFVPTTQEPMQPSPDTASTGPFPLSATSVSSLGGHQTDLTSAEEFWLRANPNDHLIYHPHPHDHPDLHHHMLVHQPHHEEQPPYHDQPQHSVTSDFKHEAAEAAAEMAGNLNFIPTSPPFDLNFPQHHHPQPPPHLHELHHPEHHRHEHHLEHDPGLILTAPEEHQFDHCNNNIHHYQHV